MIIILSARPRHRDKDCASAPSVELVTRGTRLGRQASKEKGAETPWAIRVSVKPIISAPCDPFF